MCQIFYEQFFFLGDVCSFPTNKAGNWSDRERALYMTGLWIAKGANWWQHFQRQQRLYRWKGMMRDKLAGKIKPFSITSSSDGACQLWRQHESSLKSTYRQEHLSKSLHIYGVALRKGSCQTQQSHSSYSNKLHVALMAASVFRYRTPLPNETWKKVIVL